MFYCLLSFTLQQFPEHLATSPIPSYGDYMESGLRELKERGYLIEASRHRHPTTSSSGADDLPPFSPPGLPHVMGPAASLAMQVRTVNMLKHVTYMEYIN